MSEPDNNAADKAESVFQILQKRLNAQKQLNDAAGSEEKQVTADVTSDVDGSASGEQTEEVAAIIAQAAKAFENVQVRQAADSYEKALRLLENSGIKDGEQFRDCLRNLCDVYMVLDQPKQALKMIAALRKVDDSPANKTSHLAILLHLGNRLETDEQRYEEAETMYQSALSSAKQWLPSSDPMIDRLNKAVYQARKKVVATGGYEPVHSDMLGSGVIGALGKKYTGTHKMVRSGLASTTAQPSLGETDEHKTEEGSGIGSSVIQAAAAVPVAASVGPVGAGAGGFGAVSVRTDSRYGQLPAVSTLQWVLLAIAAVLLICLIVFASMQWGRNVHVGNEVTARTAC